MKKVLALVQRHPRLSVVAVGVLLLLVTLTVISLKTRESTPVGIPADAIEHNNKAQQEIGAANELRKQIEADRLKIEELEKQIQRLEEELADAKRKTESARQAYLSSRGVTRHTPVDDSTSTDDLCTRAASLGLSKC